MGVQFSLDTITGVYGLWNVYIFGLLSLYAPSHKTAADSGKLHYNVICCCQRNCESANIFSVFKMFKLDVFLLITIRMEFTILYYKTCWHQLEISVFQLL